MRLKVKSTEKLERPGKYRLYSRQLTLSSPTDDGAVLAASARDLLATGGLPRPVRLIGVTAAGVEVPREGEGVQLSIFDSRRSRELNEALDQITERHGDGVIRRGGGAPKRVK